jgi:hypothetical protein
MSDSLFWKPKKKVDKLLINWKVWKHNNNRMDSQREISHRLFAVLFFSSLSYMQSFTLFIKDEARACSRHQGLWRTQQMSINNNTRSTTNTMCTIILSKFFVVVLLSCFECQWEKRLCSFLWGFVFGYNWRKTHLWSIVYTRLGHCVNITGTTFEGPPPATKEKKKMNKDWLGWMAGAIYV